MRLLCLDTAAETVGVAVSVEGEVRAAIVEASPAQHSRRLFRMIDEALEGADLGKADLTHVAVTRGPGSFTGLRVGVATAKGLAFALGLPLVGVSTLEALARGALPFPGAVATLLDARKRQVYAAAWDGRTGALLLDEGAWEPRAFAEALAELGEPVLGVGSGLGPYRDALSVVLRERLLCTDRGRWPIDPRHVAALAHRDAEAGLGGDPALLAPVYHRLSEAEEKKRQDVGEGGP